MIKLKRILPFFVMCILLTLALATTAFATDFEVEGIGYYYINNDTASVKVGEYTGTSPVVNIPATVENNGKTYTVTTIGESAFMGNTNITSVSLPDTVYAIFDYAFKDCTALTNVNFPRALSDINVEVFAGCTNLADINLPDSITEIWQDSFIDTAYYDNPDNWENGLLYIGEYLIKADPDITTANIREGTTLIASYAFEGCDRLKMATLPEGLEVLMGNAFDGCKSLESVNIPGTVKDIQSSAFAECSALKEVIIGNGVKNIGMNAFGYCSSLEIITIPESVVTIANWVFHDCSRLQEVRMPDSVKFIGSGQFLNTALYSNWYNSAEEILYVGNHVLASKENIKTANIKEGTISIAADAFNNRNILTNITIPDSVISIGEWAFYNTAYYNDGDNWEDGLLYIGNHLIAAEPDLTSAHIKDGTLSIAGYTFFNQQDLISVTIPDSVVTIGSHAFFEAIGLKSITLPKSLESIGVYAFNLCTGLTSIKIPDGVKNIGEHAFASYGSLRSTDIPSSVEYIGLNAFPSTTSKLETINYDGTMEQWFSINDRFDNIYIVVNCSDGVIYLGPDISNYEPQQSLDPEDANSKETLDSIEKATDIIGGAENLDPKDLPDNVKFEYDSDGNIIGATINVIIHKSDNISMSVMKKLAVSEGITLTSSFGGMNNEVEIALAGGFTAPYEPSRIHYPLNYEGTAPNLSTALSLLEAGEVVGSFKLGGKNSDTVLPTEMMLTYHTDIADDTEVTIYLYSTSGTLTEVTTTTVEDGKVVFSTDILGEFVIVAN